MAKSDEETRDGWVYYDDALHLTDFWSSLLSEGRSSDPLKEWRSFSRLPESDKRESSFLDNPFFDYWRIQVPLILSPNRGKNCLTQDYDEQEVTMSLLKPLEDFLADSSEDSEAFFEELSVYDCPPSVCGHTFLPTEPTYSCRDCGYDQTCVLCNTCFTNSIHVNHRYRVNTSGGEGFCDCGDEEAFKEGPICAVHLKHKEKELSHAELLERIPPDLRARAKELFTQIFAYVFKVTQAIRKDKDFSVGTKEKATWPPLEYVFNYSNNCVVLYNDHSHSYPDVTSTLRDKLGPGCTNKMAADITTYVDKYGLGVLKVGTYGECSTLCSKFETRLNNPLGVSMNSLKCKVVPSCMMAHMTFVSRVLSWISKKLVPKCVVFQAILSEVLLSQDNKPFTLTQLKDKSASSICDALLLLDAFVWKDVRAQWKSIISSCIMKDFESKRILAHIYSKNYADIMNAFVDDDQEEAQSIVTISIQLFAIPSLVQQLMEEENIFYRIIQCFYDLMKDYIDTQPSGKSELNLQFWQDDMNVSERSQVIPTDLGYILSLLPQSITEKTRKSFLAGMEVLTECLLHIQGLSPLTRQVHTHTEFEDMEWERPYKITAFFTDIMCHVSKWCEKDKGILVGVVNILLEKCFRNDDGDNFILRSMSLPPAFAEKEYEIMDYNVASMPVSVHLPIHRFFAKVITRFGHLMSPGLASKVKQRIEAKGSLLHLINPVLNAVVMLSQVNAGMWKRNGSAAEALVFIYALPRIARCPKKDDLILIQLATALSSDPGLIITSLMQRFRVLTWVNGDLDKIEPKSSEFYEKNNDLIDEFLSFLLALLSERSIMEGGEENPSELKHRVIQFMCIGPMKHSSLISLLGDDKDVDTLIQTLAEPKHEASKVLYHIKHSYLSSYNPFYYFYSREQRSKAFENVSCLQRKLGSEPLLCPPPSLPPFPPLFQGLYGVLRCLPIIKMLSINFKREPKNPNITAKHVHKLLFLVALGIQDDVREEIPRFLEMSEKVGLLEDLRDRSRDWPEHKEIFAYVIRRYLTARKGLLGISEGGGNDESMEEDGGGEEGSPTAASPANKARSERLAASRKAKIMAQMNQMQKKFALEHARDLVDMDISNEDETEDNESEVDPRNCVASGPSRGVPRTLDKVFTCILCQEKQKLFSQSSGGSDALIMASFIQKSAVLCGDPGSNSRRPSKCFQDYLPSDLSIGPAVSSCGHTMHAKCYQKFFSILISKEQERRHRRFVNYDVSHNEYLCPICERLSNSVLPVYPPISSFIPLLKASSEGFSAWIKRMKNILSNKTLEDTDPESSFNIYTSLNNVIRNLKLKVSSSERPTPNMEMPLLPGPLNDMCNTFAMAVFVKSLGSNPDEGDPRVLQMLFQSVAFSIGLMDARSESGMSPSQREMDTLRSLVRLCVSLPMATSSPSSSRRHMHRYLRSNVVLLFSLIFEPMDEITHNVKSYLDIDALQMLILLIVSYSSYIFGESDNQIHLGAQDQNILSLIFLLHLSQLSVSLISGEEAHMSEEDPHEDDHVAAMFIERFSSSGRRLPKTSGAARVLKDKALGFLRCASLFLNFYTDIPRGCSSGSTYEELTRYLGLPETLSELLTHSDRQEVVECLVLGASKAKGGSSSGGPGPSYPSSLRSLIDLPKSYSSLLSKVTQYKCPSSTNEAWKLPVLCLICGTIVCQFSHCCESVLDGRTVGGCTGHARKCSADVGIFLNIGECLITLIVDGERGAFLSAPYVDEYGEADDELRRGAPLFLDEKKYAELNAMWLSNSTSDKICRSYEEVLTMNSDWHTL